MLLHNVREDHMKTMLTKTEKTIAITAVIAISTFFAVFMQVSRETKSSLKFDSVENIDYTMARPDQVYSEYTLDGRELDRSFEGLPVEKSEVKIDKKKKELIDKKVAEAKKKDEVKKKQTLATKAQQQVQTQTKLKEQQIQQLKAQAAVEKNNSKRDSVVNSTYYNNSQSAQINNTVKQQNDSNTPDAKSNKKTFAEWRNILFTKPTTDNLALFVAALRKNEVSVTEYQVMAQDLISQNDAKLKGLGLMALRSAPSLESLSQLVHLEVATLGNLQSYVDQSLNAYLQVQNLRYLNQALATKDKKLVSSTLSLLSVNLTKFDQGDFSGLIDPRNSREGEVVKFSIASYKLLLPVLTQIGSSEDPELKVLAQQIASLIQSSNNVAIN